MATLRELRDSRIEKLNKLKEIGVDPYPAKSFRNTNNGDIVAKFEDFENKDVIVAGRVLSVRTHGQITFIDIKDPSGKIQLYIKSDILQNADHKENELSFDELSLIDLGDFIEGKGKVAKTQRGEISIEIISIRLLTKSLRPIPEELTDKEVRLRRRYLDINVNKDVYDRFERRAKFWEAHREFFKQNGFIEMNIPVLEAVTGGADANPFVTHMDAIDTDFYLRISQELYLKRLIGAGYPKVFEIGPRFRNEGFSDEHLPEHIAMEYYWAYANWEEGMEFTKELYRYVIKKTYGDKAVFNIKGFEVDFNKEWQILDFPEIIKERFNIDIFNTNLDEVKKALISSGQPAEKGININRGLDNLWKIIRKTVGGPAFLIHVPKFLSPLAKSMSDNPMLTERFQPIIAGSELGNGWSELNDPIDQLERFKEQQRLREDGDDEAQMLDIDFVEMLEYGMPPTLGYGHTERTFWFLEDVPAREGVPFPQLRHEIDDVTKGIYPELFDVSLSNSEVNHDKDKSGKIAAQDFSRKMVIVVDENLENWQKANSIGHVSAYLGNQLREKFGTGEFFTAEDGTKYPRNSQYPIIILRGSATQLKNLMPKVKESNLDHHIFIKEMIQTTNDQEIVDILKTKKDQDVEYLAIGVFGENEKVDGLTKKFSLYK
jgi:lysyl-tRNA synthetase class 2